jgi:hypothetical protein
VLKIATIMEGIGYSVYARIVPLSVAADLIGGTARITWQIFAPLPSWSVCAPARKKVGSGSNGWWNNSNATV